MRGNCTTYFPDEFWNNDMYFKPIIFYRPMKYKLAGGNQLAAFKDGWS